MVDPGYTLQCASGHAQAFESDLLPAESSLAWHSQDGILLEVCRASNRNAFDEYGVSLYINRTRRQEAIRTIL